MQPVLAEINQEVEDIASISLYTELEGNQKVATAYGVESLPTMILFKGGKEVDRFIGLIPAKKLRPKIEEQIEEYLV